MAGSLAEVILAEAAVAASDVSGMVQKHLKCGVCDEVFPIWRKANRNKSDGHVKHLYCVRCREITAHVELNTFYDFKEQS